MLHDLRALVRAVCGRKAEPSAVILDSRTLQATPESGHRAGYDGAKRRKGSKGHVAVDTLGHLLAAHVTPATEPDRAQVSALASAVQEVTGDSVTLAYGDQGYRGEEPAKAAQAQGIRLEVVRLPEAKRGFVLLPRRWVVERSFAGWRATLNGCRKPLRPCTSSHSQPSCSTKPSPSSIKSLTPSSDRRACCASANARRGPCIRTRSAGRAHKGPVRSGLAQKTPDVRPRPGTLGPEATGPADAARMRRPAPGSARSREMLLRSSSRSVLSGVWT